jgi:hypothetical protein
MNARSKVVDLDGTKFHVRKLTPDVGSFILMRMLGLSMQAARVEAEKHPEKTGREYEAPRPVEAKPEVKVSGEDRTRALVFSIMSSGISFEEFSVVQKAWMQAVTVPYVVDGIDMPMPVMSHDGAWTKHGEGLANDVALVMRLTSEVLVFCFASFFEPSGPGLTI